MWLSAARTSNILFATACAVVITVGSLEIHDRLFGEPRGATVETAAGPAAVEPIADLLLTTESATIRSVGTPHVAIAEFSDFQCPYCAQYAAETYSQIQKEFVDTGHVAYVFFNFPLDRVHPYALQAGYAVECAGGQGHFWQMHDRMFAEHRQLGDSKVFEIAAALNIDRRAFEACLENRSNGRVRDQVAVAQNFGVSSTPTFLLGRIDATGVVRVKYRILGAQPFSVFSSKLGELIDQGRALDRR